jgi:hypothetical protein
MASKATALRRPGDVMAVSSVTVQAIIDMAGLTVFLVKVRVSLPKGLFNELFFPFPGGHYLIKYGIVTLVASDTPAGSIVTGCRMSDPFRVIPMARRAGHGGMHPFERNILGVCRTNG